MVELFEHYGIVVLYGHNMMFDINNLKCMFNPPLEFLIGISNQHVGQSVENLYGEYHPCKLFSVKGLNWLHCYKSFHVISKNH